VLILKKDQTKMDLFAQQKALLALHIQTTKSGLELSKMKTSYAVLEFRNQQLKNSFATERAGWNVDLTEKKLELLCNELEHEQLRAKHEQFMANLASRAAADKAV